MKNCDGVPEKQCLRALRRRVISSRSQIHYASTNYRLPHRLVTAATAVIAGARLDNMFAAPPIMNLTVLRSPDIDRASKFYSRMGLLFTKHRHGSGPEHYTSCVDGFVFEIYPLGKQPATIGTRIGFSVDDVDSICAMLIEIGAELVSAPADSQWGRRAVVKDLDGHVVELLTPPNRDKIVASNKTSTGVRSP